MKLTTLKPRVQVLADNRVSEAPKPHQQWHHLYGYAWQKRRAAHLRQFPLCEYCLRSGRVMPATIGDHITPHLSDAALFAGPIQSLCETCHDSVKAKEEIANGQRGR